MKRCPECRRDYYDDTLSFCLNDGTELVYGLSTDEAATAILTEDGFPGRAQTNYKIKRTDETAILPEKSPRPSPAFRKSAVLAGILGIVLVTAVGVGSYLYFGRGPVKQIDSIAVMPFINQSGTSDLEYLSDGITETLISSLTQLPRLAVKPRSSVFRYKGKDVDAKTIGRELDVVAILNGTIVQRGNEMGLHVELIDTANETLLWSRDYKRPITNLVALQSEITRDVVEKLKFRLNSTDEQRIVKNYTENAEAYQLYLQGRYFWNKQNVNNVERSIEYFQKAIEVDPDYALAYTGLADAYSLNIFGTTRERMARSRQAALKALSLDADLPEAHASLGRILSVDDYDFEGAERELRRAVELNPNYGIGHHFLGDLLSIRGKFEESFAAHERALELEPFSAVFNSGYGSSLTRARRYDQAIARYNKALELDPSFWGAYGRLSVISEIRGEYAEAVELRSKAFEANGDARGAALMRQSFANGGWIGFNRLFVTEKRPQNAPSYLQAVAFTALGERDKAFEALNKSFDDHEISLVQLLNNDQRLDQLRTDPRFHDLMKRIGFAK